LHVNAKGTIMEHMTSNPGSVVDEGQFTVRRTIQIAAPIEKVWSAVTQPEHISQWFGTAVIHGAGVGARGTLTFEGYGAVPLRIEAFDAPRLVSYRWGNDDASGVMPDDVDEHSTVFTFTLEPTADGTQLTVVDESRLVAVTVSSSLLVEWFASPPYEPVIVEEPAAEGV